MESEDRGPDLLWGDRIAALLAGVTTVLPFAWLPGEMLAAIAARVHARIVAGDLRSDSGSFDWSIAALILVIGAALAALALSGCRGLWRGRRSGFVVAGVFSLLGLPLAFLLWPLTMRSGAPPTAFLIVALAVAAYARLRLTVVGPTPI